LAKKGVLTIAIDWRHR